ncbi:hypothetical protein GOP47_0024065 [Adiantum capillus-veneris]|uniref:Uncharacterized protein n=1 Tax=Adiantum capillus-veneris TaxID=13818 RepID=A0A9D4U5Q1_ADICA|nr:hypothetical protein GOP47_0024065 [Adiantum capillus-veneris]
MVGRQPCLDLTSGRTLTLVYMAPTSNEATSSIGSALVPAPLGNGFIGERNRNASMEIALIGASKSFGAGIIDGTTCVEAPSGFGACANHAGICECAKCRRLAARSYEARRKREYCRKLKESWNQYPSCPLISKRQAIAKRIVTCFKQHTRDLDNETNESIMKDVLNDGCMRGLKIET